MKKYIVVKNNVIENFILSETPPPPQLGETILLASNYNKVTDLQTPYDSIDDTFLTRFKGQFKPQNGPKFFSSTSSVDLVYNTAIVEINESNIRIEGEAQIKNFITNSFGANFDLILNEELISSSNKDQIIKLDVDRSIKDTRGYTTIINPLEIEYISGSF